MDERALLLLAVLFLVGFVAGRHAHTCDTPHDEAMALLEEL